MPRSIKPRRYLISIIQDPARGSKFNEPEKVPTISSGMLNPIAKEKSNTKPAEIFEVATKVSINKSPGDKHGEAIVPLVAPNRNAATKLPPLCCGVSEKSWHTNFIESKQ